MSVRLGEEETELIISHLENVEKEIEAVRNILSGRFEIKKQVTPSPNGEKVSDNGSIQLNIDVSGIVFKQKAGVIAGPYAKWGWSFVYQQNGEYHEESQKLVQALEQYGSVQVGNRVYSLGGNDGKLLQMKEA